MRIEGKITKRILGLLAAGKLDQSAIHPGRPASPTKATKIPKGVKGQSLGKRGGKK